MSYTTGTVGTNGTTTLTPAVVWGLCGGTTAGNPNVSAANFATNYVAALANLNATLEQYQDGYDVSNEDSINSGHYQYGMIQQGMLYYPSRGWLKLYPGDVIACDPVTYWPILLNRATANNGSTSWTITPNI